MRPVPIAVVGFGRFGRLHAGRLLGHPQFQLSCIVDTDAGSRDLAASMGIEALGDVADLPSDVIAAAVTTPPDTHSRIASMLMRRGVHVLVEKPLATHESDIARLLAVARQTGRILCTGHVERFNPKNVQICEGDIVDFRRQSSGMFDGRHAVLDLLVHDLDLLAYWLDLPTDATLQVTASRLSNQDVEATCVLAGLRVRLRASYGAAVSGASVICGSASPAANTLAQSLKLFNTPTLHGQDALTRQYSAFHDRLSGVKSAIADGVAGSVAARRALAILRAL